MNEHAHTHDHGDHTHEPHDCVNVEVTHGKQSDVTISAEIPAENVATYRTKAIKELGKDAKIDGFRQGNVPEDVLLKHVGEPAVMQKTAELAISDQYPKLVMEQHLPIIGTPNVSITKLAPDNPIGFTITAALLPELTLPDYKTIAKEHAVKREEQTVTDDEVQETLTHLRRERAKIEKMEKDKLDPQQAHEVVQKMDTLQLPGIDDPFVQSLGYENVDVFTDKLKENIKNEKDNREREKTRIAILEDIIKKTKVTLPEILIENELDIMEGQFRGDIERQGMKYEDYLKQAGKEREEVRKSWQEAAEKRAKMHLIVREIADAEKIEPDPDTVEREVEHILEHEKQADPLNVRAYVMQALRSELVFRFLEDQK